LDDNPNTLDAMTCQASQ